MQGRGRKAGEKIGHGKFSRRGWRGQGDLVHPWPSPLGYRPLRLSQALSVAQMLKLRLLLRSVALSSQPGPQAGLKDLVSSAARSLPVFSLIFWGDQSYQSSCEDPRSQGPRSLRSLSDIVLLRLGFSSV